MKKNRKLIAILTAAYLTMPVALAAVPLTVSAAGTNSVTVNERPGYSNSNIAAYKIFQGTYDSGNHNLTVTDWGNGITSPSDFIDALKASSLFGTGTGNLFYYVDSNSTPAGAVAVADIVADFASDQTKTEAFSKTALSFKGTSSGTVSDNQISDLEDGYYVIADKGTASGGSSWSLGLLQVAGGGNVKINPKLGIPSIEKKVKENAQYTLNEGYNDIADYSIGDNVPFKIVGTLPDNFAQYDHYYYCITDTLDAAFDMPTDPSEISVAVDGNAISADGNCRISLNAAAHKISISFEDIRSACPSVTQGSEIAVTYNARLNSNAVTGLSGNASEVQLGYSNDPNEAYDPDTGNASEDKPSEIGLTPADKVVVFTYELDVKKVDGVTDAGLQNAEFTLTNSSGNYATAANGIISGWTDTPGAATKFISGSNGNFNITGLDDGIYTLTEVTAPAGYNILTNGITVNIDSTTANETIWDGDAAHALTALKVVVNSSTETPGDTAAGKVSVIVKNNKGTTLPTTGGIGTKIFYILGGTLVIGSGTALIIKKRIDKNEK